MNLYLRLYYPEDADLIAIRIKTGSKFPNLIRTCLQFYLNGDIYTYKIPENISSFVKETKKIFLVNIQIKEKDPVSIFLQKLDPRARISVVKMIFRFSYDRFPLEIFCQSGHAKDLPVINTASYKQKMDKFTVVKDEEHEQSVYKTNENAFSTSEEESFTSKKNSTNPEATTAEKKEVGISTKKSKDNPHVNKDDAMDILSKMIGF